MIDYEYQQRMAIVSFYRDAHDFFNFNDALNSWFFAEQLYAEEIFSA